MMTAVRSTNLAAVDYNPDTQVLIVEYRSNGSTEDFPNITPQMYNDLMNAPSIGTFFHNHISRKKKGVR